MECPSEQRIYITLNYPSQKETKTLLTGIKQDLENPSVYYISGFTKNETKSGNTKYETFVYKGNLSGTSISDKSNWNTLKYPSSTGNKVINTNLYGPSLNSRNENIKVVGNYTTKEGDSKLYGCLYQGSLNGKGKWLTLTPPGSVETIVHSTMGDLAVGNYLVDGDKNSKAFIYNIKKDTYLEITKPGSKSITSYGIWQNNKNHYTIAGGYSERKETGDHLAYICDYNSQSKEFSNWQSYNHNNQKGRITHFEGISAYEKGYSLPSDSVVNDKEVASIAYIRRKKDGTFSSKCKWEDVSVPNRNICSANSIAGSTLIGVATSNPDIIDGFVSIVI